MAPLQVECPKCHATNKPGAKYCGKCGERMPGMETKCNNCGAVVPADKKFCGNCGKPLAESEAPLMKGNRWARRVDDFATKAEVDDVEGFFKRGLIVEAGTKALFFVNGAYSGILEPGRYDMGGLLQKIKNLFSYKTATAVLMDAGDVELQFSVEGLPTRDPIRLMADCRLVVQLESPTQFFENMMKGRQNYPLPEMKAFLEGELRNCMVDFIAGKSIQELSTNLAFKQEIEQKLAQHLAKTFDRKGLSFIQVRIFNFRHPRMDALTNKKEEYWLHAEDLKIRLEGQDSALGLERKLLDQETVAALTEVEVYEERARINERMRKAMASSEMDRVTSAVELEKFMEGMDKDKMLRGQEIEDLKRDFGEKKENHDLARRHLIQRMKIEQDADLQRAGLLGRIMLDRTADDATRQEEMARLEHTLAAQRRQLEAVQAMEWSQLKQELESKKAVVDSEIGLEKDKFDAGLDMTQKKFDMEIGLGRKKQETELDLGLKKTEAELKKADAELGFGMKKADAELGFGKKKAETELDLGRKQAEAELEIARKKAEAGFELGRKQKLSDFELKKLEDEADLHEALGSLDVLKKQKTIKKEEADADVERELRARSGISEVTMREEAQRHQQEIAKIQVLSTLSMEALIAAAPADRAAMLAELKRTETLKGFSEEQILAMAADKNVEVARVFQEKYRAASAPEMQQAYERMLAMKDQGMADLKEMSREHTRMMQEMYNRGMDTQRDTAMAAARAPQQGMTVVTPGLPPAGVVQVGAGAPPPAPPAPAPERRVVLCPECHLETDEGHKFCDNCGHKFFG